MARSWCLPLALIVAGCGAPPDAPTDTGARDATKDFFEALVRKDWQRAHAALHPESRAKCGAAQFEPLAQHYRRQLGFEPQAAKVRACEEQGTEALAHVVLTGAAQGKQRTYKDAVKLRQSATGWGVVLPSRFGQER